jgi:hypothetical protein
MTKSQLISGFDKKLIKTKPEDKRYWILFSVVKLPKQLTCRIKKGYETGIFTHEKHKN